MVQYFRLVVLALLLSVGVGSVGQSRSNSVAVVNNVTELAFSYLNAIPMGPLGSNFDKGWCDKNIVEPKTIMEKIFQKRAGVSYLSKR